VNWWHSVLETEKREEAEVENDSVDADIGPMGLVSIHKLPRSTKNGNWMIRNRHLLEEAYNS